MEDVIVIIDPQKDFIISPSFKGSLGVPGAYEDMLRISQYIREENPAHIVVTLDTHSKFDIAHNEWWVNEKGEHPNPFTEITEEDVKKGVWKAAKPEFQEHAEFYVTQLAKQNKYKLLVWPNHCIKGEEGHQINPELAEALKEWEIKNDKKVEYVYKGMNHKTEHYSALKAEVVLDDEDTKLQTGLIASLVKFSKIIIVGEASSHCVGGTTIDLLENIEEKQREKVTIFKNCMSAVPGFEAEAEKFFLKAKELKAKIVDWLPAKKLKIR